MWVTVSAVFEAIVYLLTICFAVIAERREPVRKRNLRKRITGAGVDAGKSELLRPILIGRQLVPNLRFARECGSKVIQRGGRNNPIVIGPNPKRGTLLVKSAAERLREQKRVNRGFAIDVDKYRGAAIVGEIVVDFEIVLIAIELRCAYCQEIVERTRIGRRRVQGRDFRRNRAEADLWNDVARELVTNDDAVNVRVVSGS